jgi:hypothetical protein
VGTELSCLKQVPGSKSEIADLLQSNTGHFMFDENYVEAFSADFTWIV